MKESGPNTTSEPIEVKKHPLEGAVLAFEDPEEGKSTDIRIKKINRTLGSGSVGLVSEVEVELANDESSDKKTHKMAIKEYWKEGTDAGKNLQDSYENYKSLRRAGIHTWDTYRINKEQKIALMTLGTVDTGFLLTTNDRHDHRTQELFKKNPLLQIENMDEFVDEVKSILNKANENGYRLQPDTWGVIYSPSLTKPDTYGLKPIIADLDSLDKSDDPYYEVHYGKDIKQTWIEENMEYLEMALFGIFPGTWKEKTAWCSLIMQKVKNNSQK